MADADGLSVPRLVAGGIRLSEDYQRVNLSEQHPQKNSRQNETEQCNTR